MDELSADREFEPNSIPFVVFGTIILFVSWLFFNGGSTLSMFSTRNSGISKIMMVTIVSGTTGGAIATFLKPVVLKEQNKHNKYDVGATTNGILAGLVAITGVCDRIEPWGALIVGIISAFVYCFSCRLLKAINIDDPIEASPVHGFTGFWGLIAVGIFDNQYGLLSGTEGCWSYLLMQLVGAFVIATWTLVMSGAYFLVMRRAGLLRVPLIEEVLGLDIAEHGVHTPKFKDALNESFQRRQSFQKNETPRTNMDGV